MRLRTYSAFSVMLLFTGFGCDKDPVTSSSPKELANFIWSVDTLAYPGSFQTLMSDIWGSSANNLYVVGHNSGSIGIMFKFDGKVWSEVKLNVAQGGNIREGMTLESIYGFGPNDIWAVGRRALNNPNPPPNFFHRSVIIHFDGKTWQEVDLSRAGAQPQEASLETIWGSSPNDIWAGGLYGTLFHFNGTAWKREFLPLTFPDSPEGFSAIRAITGSSPENAFMTVYKRDEITHRETNYLMKLTAGQWAVVDSFNVPPILSGIKWGDLEMWYAPWNVLYSVGSGGIFRGKSMPYEWWLIGGNTYTDIAGTDENNILAVGIFGSAYHFNGDHWAQLKVINHPSLLYTGVWMDERNVFVIGTTNGVTMILHGK